MDYFKKFYTLTRIYALRNWTVQQTFLRNRHKKVVFSTAACCHNLLKRPKNFNSNLPGFRIYQFKLNSCALRYFSADNLDQSRHMISTFEVRTNPVGFLSLLMIDFQQLYIRVSVDSSFNLQEFVQSSEQAAMVVSKLISEKRLSELEGLVSSECLTRLSESIDNWVPFEREDIAITDNDFAAVMPYDFKVKREEERNALEVSLFFHIIKNIKSEIRSAQKESSSGLPDGLAEMLKMAEVLKDPAKIRKIYGANYRFIKWLDKDGSGDWIINGVNHFKQPSSAKT